MRLSFLSNSQSRSHRGWLRLACIACVVKASLLAALLFTMQPAQAEGPSPGQTPPNLQAPIPAIIPEAMSEEETERALKKAAEKEAKKAAKTKSSSKDTQAATTTSAPAAAKTATKSTTTAQATPPPPTEIQVRVYDLAPFKVEVQPVTVNQRKLRKKYEGYEIRLVNQGEGGLFLLDAHVLPALNAQQVNDPSGTAAAPPTFVPNAVTGVEGQTTTVTTKISKDSGAFQNVFLPSQLPSKDTAIAHMLVAKDAEQAVLRITYKDSAGQVQFIEQPLELNLVEIKPSTTASTTGDDTSETTTKPKKPLNPKLTQPAESQVPFPGMLN